MSFDKDEVSEFHQITRWFFGILIALMLLGGGVTVASRLFDLEWFPWDIKMRTGMIRASNSYITTQQQALRTFRMAYDNAPTSGQKAAIMMQMREIADTIPQDVQPDIRSFLSLH